MARKKLKTATIQRILLGVLAAVTLAVVAFAVARPDVQPAARSFTPAPIVTTPSKDFRSVAVVGDSFVTGSAMGGKDAANWTQLVSKSLTTDKRTVDLQASGLAGSGYVKRGPTKKVFIEAIPGAVTRDTSLFVFFGSINDIDESPQNIEAAAAEAFAAAKKAAPKAKLLVFGPAWPHPERIEDIAVRRDALKAAATKAGATFVDPFDAGWFQGSAFSLIGEDGTHPTNEGHAYMAKLMAPHIQKALGA